jgi:uncharacterized protein Yka (UPF0111/DUF47 family)
MAVYTEKVFQFEDQQASLLKIRTLEVRCGELAYKITKRLNKTFITPFDREDIFALVKRLDDISDMLLGATARVETFHIDKKIDYTDKVAAIIHSQIKELGIAIQDLKVKRINEMKAVKTLESEADKIYQQAIRELFEREKDAIELIKKREIIDILEKTSDKCQSAANIILSIFIKNS